MEIKRVALVLVDISGYTRFIKMRKISLLHAELIITKLIESVIETAEFPLTLNKLEGDAALLYTPIEENVSINEVTEDVAKQALLFFEAFKKQQQDLISDVYAECPCDACTNIENLRLKVFLHEGEVVIKKIRQFEELAGEALILIHRLLKNSINADEYLLMTEDFFDASGGFPELQSRIYTENYPTIGNAKVYVYFPDTDKTFEKEIYQTQTKISKKLIDHLVMGFDTVRTFFFSQKDKYRNLPD